mmetsp:Transcript_29838/g.45756  ORF Transcript_29838/g.45756 Transcript_29838/m.45756 type:complete len:410 (-) Transcript_29838:184-1413(-)|eukprot:CAMPEP_0195303772 /NCGR_PEP_ID=MMETSP0707-20130614/33342_1 /TAXON_ID=33640 /ORGANISM="Asterionellopsis glacialis, Strain CCMP134" /LENGTH=409 /DNA_ID=CAMNT_0040367411 /DNA_START=139 /DNA_END=1368 /DNA_ORIENTATION=+
MSVTSVGGRVGNSILNAIGNTPLLKLSNIKKHLGIPSHSTIYAKLENLNPGGSKKDRVAKQLVLDALENGDLVPDQPLVELTSGNTGTGLAIVAQSLGLDFTAVMSKGNSIERSQMMTALGAKVVLVDQHDSSLQTPQQGVSGLDLQLVEEETCRLVEMSGAFRANQFTLPGAFRAHYDHTGPECWNQIAHLQQQEQEQEHQSSSLPRHPHPQQQPPSPPLLDAFVDFVGTGGTFVGISKYLKEQSNSNIQCHVVEPHSCRILDPSAASSSLNIATKGNHKIQGGGYSKRLDELSLFHHAEIVQGGCSPHTTNTNTKNNTHHQNPQPQQHHHHHYLIDGYISVSDEEAIQTSRLLATTEGIFGGFSSGANVAAAAQLLKHHPDTIRHVLVIICDSGLKYLSTDLYSTTT